MTAANKQPKSFASKGELSAAEEIDPAEMRDTLVRSMAIPDLDPKHLIPEAYDKLISGKKKLESKGEEKDLMERVAYTLGFENDYVLVETMDDKYRGMAIEMRRQLIKDFDCKTYAEKVLVDTIVSGYVRTIRCAKSFNNCTHTEFLSSYKNQYMANVSKEMDRAQRQLMAAYQMLINLKRPPLQVNVKAQQAFVAQAQQFNAAKKEESV
ncbi:MAG: hypothetical protein HYR90_02900 [Candidatus Andersenbacteria bacterium]|nr:hypothetical protein [Candidatus Andersenbacteria bacterium]MBI3251106.1 hypothetical protein [Candidatus Andersenbacteria bacterium]